jgi:polyphosphate kinase
MSVIDKSRFLPKEITWLHFNHRVLQEASDTSLPLIERLKFLGIFSNNQDEFFRVRVAILKRMAESKKRDSDTLFGHRPLRVLKEVQRIVMKHMEQFQETYEEIVRSLANEGIQIIDESQLDESQTVYVRDFFQNHVRPNLVPIMLSQATKFPELQDQAIYFAVKLVEKKGEVQYALLQIPTHVVGRFVRLPNQQGKSVIMLLDDVIRACLRMVFPLAGQWKQTAYMVKVSRDADMDLDDDLDDSYINKISDSLRRRRWGKPTRITYDEDIPEDLKEYLLEAMNVQHMETLLPGGRYHNFKDFFGFPHLGRTDLIHPPFDHLPHRDFPQGVSFFDVLRKKDVLLHFPYHSFSPVIDILREAAVDPKVLSIQITIYRLAKNSKIINALISAAKNGKNVQVILELQARFDEKANLKWADILRNEGVDVHFGVEDIKIHSKLCLITREENKQPMLYAMMATGNFNESTSKLYTDHTLMTARRSLTREAAIVFEFINKPYQNRTFRSLLVSPVTMRSRITRFIENEIKNAKAGKKASICLKLNNMADVQLADLLYQASEAGVEVRIIIRGMCSLIPGLEDVGQNIKAISIVDRLLEHSRFYIFHNGGRPLVYVSSADWMSRNMDYRVEVAFPIIDKKLKKEIMQIFDIQWRDNVKARRVDGKGNNKPANSDKEFEAHRAQMETLAYIRQLES